MEVLEEKVSVKVMNGCSGADHSLVRLAVKRKGTVEVVRVELSRGEFFSNTVVICLCVGTRQRKKLL